MSWNKKIKERVRKNKIKAGFLFCFLVFLTLSLFSYHPQDSSFNFVGLSTKVSNYCGFIGASLADAIYQLFGFAGAWLLIFGGLGLVLKLFTRPLSENHLSSFILFLLFLLSSISLTELNLPSTYFFNGEVSLGGVLGQNLVSSLKPLLGAIGTGVILWSSFLAFILFYGQLFFPFLLALPKKTLLFLFIKSRFLWKKRTGLLLKQSLLKINPILILVLGKKLFRNFFFLFKNFGIKLLSLLKKSPQLRSLFFFKSKSNLSNSKKSIENVNTLILKSSDQKNSCS